MRWIKALLSYVAKGDHDIAGWKYIRNRAKQHRQGE